jgi:hypothetical protein
MHKSKNSKQVWGTIRSDRVRNSTGHCFCRPDLFLLNWKVDELEQTKV